MRGYFGIGADRISKAANLGALMRTAHAFGAGFVFTIGAVHSRRDLEQSDTSGAAGNLPCYRFDGPETLLLPQGCSLVGIEIAEEAIELPSFHHPKMAAYVLGPERGELAPDLLARCDHVVRIPTRFAVNVALAGALAMYDRMLCMGRFAPRPHRPGAPSEPAPVPAFGPPLWVGKQRRRERAAAAAETEGR